MTTPRIRCKHNTTGLSVVEEHSYVPGVPNHYRVTDNGFEGTLFTTFSYLEARSWYGREHNKRASLMYANERARENNDPRCWT